MIDLITWLNIICYCNIIPKIYHYSNKNITITQNISYTKCESLLKKDGMMLEYIKNPTVKLKLIALKQNGLALKYIQNQTNKMHHIALNNNLLSIKYINNEEKKKYFKKKYKLNNLKNSYDDFTLFLDEDYRIKYWRHQLEYKTMKYCLNVIHENIHFFKESILYPKMNICFVNNEIKYLYNFLKNQTNEVILSYIKKDGLILRLIKNPTNKMIYTAIKQNGLAICLIDNQTEKMKVISLKQNKLALKCIKNPDIKKNMIACENHINNILYY